MYANNFLSATLFVPAHVIEMSLTRSFIKWSAMNYLSIIAVFHAQNITFKIYLISKAPSSYAGM